MRSNRSLSYNFLLTKDLGGTASNLCHLFEPKSELVSWLSVTCVLIDSPDRSSGTICRQC